MGVARGTHPAATRELVEAAKYYEDARAGLGEDFLDLAEEVVRTVIAWPEAAPVLPGWTGEPPVRALGLKRFPYRVIYYVDGTEFMIVAYAHTRLKPWYWLDRLPATGA